MKLKLLRDKAEEVVGIFCGDGILEHVNEDGKQLCGTTCPLLHTIKDGEERKAFAYLKHKNGYRVPVVMRSVPIYQQGAISGAVEIFQDMTHVKNIHEKLAELKEQVYLDKLTELPNRHFLEMILETRWSRYKNKKILYGALFIDVDNFKEINDTYGHATGDQALRAVAKTLRSGIREDDIVGRWGGDEFLIVFEGINEAALDKIGKKLVALMNSAYFKAGSSSVYVTISIGAGLVRGGDMITDVIERADKALYQAKDIGKNTVISTIKLSKEPIEQSVN